MEVLSADQAWQGWPEPVLMSSVGSTMDEVRRRAGEGAPEGFVVRAEEQTQGRGRHGRPWLSPPGSGLWWNILLRPDRAVEAISALPLVVGVSVVTALTGHLGVSCGLKWPNDVLATTPGPHHFAKIAGILAERLADGSVMVGVGLNVAQQNSQLPAGGASLDMLLGRATDREALFAALLIQVARDYRRWQNDEWSLDEYRAHCLTLGHAVRVGAMAGSAQPPVEGRAVGIDAYGHLVVATDSGDEQVVSAGDVTLLPRT
jgi:BirA family transcriptional regulator, biotin operon repressor / biotin---[acetyl-CoA-carboxylase] ligase